MFRSASGLVVPIPTFPNWSIKSLTTAFFSSKTRKLSVLSPSLTKDHFFSPASEKVRMASEVVIFIFVVSIVMVPSDSELPFICNTAFGVAVPIPTFPSL